jgi:hypothetical protein
MEYYIYKYVENNKIIYIGQTTNLERRIKDHTKDKLANFKGDIYYFECPNQTAMNSWEYCLINKYHPPYNIALKDTETKINIAEPEWKKYKNPTKMVVIENTGNLLYFPTKASAIKKPKVSSNKQNIEFRCSRCRKSFKTQDWFTTAKGFSAICPLCHYSVWVSKKTAKNQKYYAELMKQLCT